MDDRIDIVCELFSVIKKTTIVESNFEEIVNYIKSRVKDLEKYCYFTELIDIIKGTPLLEENFTDILNLLNIKDNYYKIQFSQALKSIIQQGKKMNVFHIFPNNSFNLVDKTITTRIFGIPEDDIKGDKIIDTAIIKRKENKLNYLQHKTDFDYVIGNPPYVANDTNPVR